MNGIPTKCPKCGRAKTWKEEVNIFKSGILVRGLGRVRFGTPRGLLAKPFMKAAGYYKVTYRCHNCGFQKEFDLSE